MHIPDGFLDPLTTVSTASVAVAGVGLALRRLQGEVGGRLVPLVGVTAATIFAAQMVNFPLTFVGLPASGHVTGGVLAAVLLGPWGSVLAMTTVLIVQCLVFGDGGLTALGANVVNMALIGSGAGYALYALLRQLLGGTRGLLVGATLAAWLMVPAAALAFSLEISAAGVIPFGRVAPWMLWFHIPIGAAEAMFTLLALRWLLRVRPELIYAPTEATAPRTWPWSVTAIGLSVALSVALFAAPWASSLADGLETVADQLGFVDRAQSSWPAPLPDYGVEASPFALAQNVAQHAPAALVTALVGACGTLLTWASVTILARAARSG